MKILYEVGSTCIGGAERVALRLARGIKRLRPDWQLDAIVMCDRGGLEGEYRATFPTLIDGPGPVGYYQLAGPALAKAVKAGGYDVCHCIDSFDQTAEAAQACPETRFIQAVYPNVDKSPFAPSPDWLADIECPYAAIVTEFRANLRRLPTPGRSPHILCAIPNGIDTEFWTPDDGARYLDVAWCARTDPEKGIGAAMDLVPLLCGAGLNYTLITSEHDGPVDRLQKLEYVWVGKGFRWRWKRSPEDLRALFRHTKIFVSTSTVEGMPATPMEAAACGCWPLVPEIDGLAEVFGPECHPNHFESECPRCMFTYPPDTIAGDLAAAIRNRMNRVHKGPSPRGIAERYSIENMVNRYLELYEALLAKE